MKKHIVIWLLVALLCGLLAGCGTTATENSTESAEPQLTNTPSEEPLSGGWTLTATQAVELPEDLQGVQLDNLTPVALVGEQVVAGKNYMLLCNDGGAYKMAVIYRDLQGKAELTGQSDFALTDYTQTESAAPAEEMTGAWAAPEAVTSLALPEDAQAAFDKALAEFVGSSIEPMALLGTQVVAGTNYAILCRVTPVVPDATSTVEVVTVYADLQGHAQFTSFCALDYTKYN